MHFTYGLASRKGSEREVNSNAASAFVWPDIPHFDGQNVGLFIVADGVSAAQSGNLASQLAVQIVAEEIKTLIFQPSNLSISDLLTTAVHKANLQLIAEAPPDGISLTAALIVGNQLYIAHVGDSRAYYAYGKYLIQLTDDHRFLQRMIDQGIYTWAQVEAGEVIMANVLYRALGQNENLEVDIVTEHLEDGSCILLTTNGLSGWKWDYSEQMRLLSVMQNNPPQAACDDLIERAQNGGAADDITVIIIKMSEQ